jgi:hypothetical protein
MLVRPSGREARAPCNSGGLNQPDFSRTATIRFARIP